MFSACFSENRPKTAARIPKEEYLKTVRQLQNHIVEGDVYEVNFCQEFYAQSPDFNPLAAFWQLMEASPMPFSGFLKLQDKFLLCASPERFLKREKDTLISQPIKGTIRRGLYSGSLGYFLPNGDFDFNVVIRSLLYNGATGYLSYHVGSAITYDSDPEQEYQECLLKAEAIVAVLAQN